MDTIFCGQPAIGRFAQFKFQWRRAPKCDTFPLFSGGYTGEVFGHQRFTEVRERWYSEVRVQHIADSAVQSNGSVSHMKRTTRPNIFHACRPLHEGYALLNVRRFEIMNRNTSKNYRFLAACILVGPA